jgi:hypothetical protein
MKYGRLVRGTGIFLAMLGMCVPEMGIAAAPAATPAVADVALADGGVLHGQLVDLRGGNSVGVPVSVKAQNSKEIVRTTTAKDGRFAVKGLKGGVYQVAAGQGQGVYRLWTAKAAPPSAGKNAIVFTQGLFGGGPKMLLANPVVVAGVVATAVAVPVAVVNSQPSSP